MKIVIIDYGAGNIQSIQFALERLGYSAVLSDVPNEIRIKIIYTLMDSESISVTELSKKIGVVDGEQYAKAEIDFLYLVTVNPIVIESSYKTQVIFPHQIKNFVWIKDIQNLRQCNKLK